MHKGSNFSKSLPTLIIFCFKKIAITNQNHNEVPLHSSQDGCYPKVYKQ